MFKKYHIFFGLKFVLAFCSIVYELLLAQALSAFLDNTVLRYSVTIGLYMFSMGVGALLAEKRMVQTALLSLMRIEIFLTLIGGFSLIFLHLVDYLDLGRLVFSLFAHGLIIVIGVLTGMEIPLIMMMVAEHKKDKENVVLAFDYTGAFLGTILFAFYFYPSVGLMPTAFMIAFLNAICGISLMAFNDQIQEENKNQFFMLAYVLMGMFILITLCCIYADSLSEYFLQMYLRR